MENIHHQRLLDDISKLMDSGAHSDIIIRCRGKEFKVHKAIISSSPSLALACKGGWSETEDGVIVEREFDIDDVERLISYIYKSSYDAAADAETTVKVRSYVDGEAEPVESTVTVTGTSARLIAHIRAYAMGELRQMPTLKTFARDQFATCVSPEEFETSGFVHVIREVNIHVPTDDDDFRDLLKTIAHDNVIKLTKDADFMSALIELPDVEDFAAVMLRQMVHQDIMDKEAHQQQLSVKFMEIQSLERDLQRLRLERETKK